MLCTPLQVQPHKQSHCQQGHAHHPHIHLPAQQSLRHSHRQHQRSQQRPFCIFRAASNCSFMTLSSCSRFACSSLRKFSQFSCCFR